MINKKANSIKAFLTIGIFIVVCISVTYFGKFHSVNADSFNSIYYIESKLASGMVVDIKSGKTANKTNCQLYKNNNTAAQLFVLVSEKSGYYTIRLARERNKVLTVAGEKGNSGANVMLYQYNGNNTQLWKLENIGSGYYYIASKTGFYLDVAGAKTTNGTNIQVYKKNQSDAQIFKFKENYNITKAVKYAQKYTDNSGNFHGLYNTVYNIYRPDNIWRGNFSYRGYDCANFVSQCLFEGGLRSTSGWSPVYRGEGYKGNKAKTTWVSAVDLYEYLKSLDYPISTVKSDFSNVKTGDIVVAMDEDTGKAKHMTICTGYQNGKPYFCAHSKWRKNVLYIDQNQKDYFKGAKVIDMSFGNK